ncbi:site-specific DNA-methyltransferase [Xanthobacter versatilis]|uniref:site-specific DNA-methyltransferase n=1 Tax=Xanthobacter autotrophicus (strain ATCC BAA-1158 / Py2) TaxID=78245 RepID=UPI003728F0DE
MTTALPRLHLIELEKMKKLDAESPETKSADIISGNVEVLKSLFPDAFTEGKIDFEVLKALLGGSVDEREEKYGLNWHGKRRARQIALTPSAGTLLPCPEESLDWDTTRNLMIEGDNLEVLKLLQKSYAGKVKLIYIDPPYNTGKDFVYPDNFRDGIGNYLEITSQIDDDGRRLSSNTDFSGRFHTNWINMMYPRLKLARNLLHNNGVIFVTIDDTEVANLREIANEIFGEENFVANVVWQKKYAKQNDATWFSTSHDHILVFAKSKDAWRPNLLERTQEQLGGYANPDNDPRGPWQSVVYTCNKTRSERPNLYYGIEHPSRTERVFPSETRVWGYEEPTHQKHVEEKRLWWGKNNDLDKPRLKVFLKEVGTGLVPDTLWLRTDVGDNQDAKRILLDLIPEAAFETPKPPRLIERMIELATKPDADDIVLDFFAGSGTTGQAVMNANLADSGNRRWLLVQLPEPTGRTDYKTVFDITKARVTRAAERISTGDRALDFGFRVFKLAASNIRAWEPDASDLEDSLLKNAEHLVQGRKERDVLYELLLKLGLDLCVPVETKTIAGKTVHSIGGGALIVCLSDGLTKGVVEELAKGIVDWRKALAPAVDTRVVFKDTGFADDIAKTNMAAILNQAGIADVRSL